MTGSSPDVSIPLPPELLEAIAARVADLLAERNPSGEDSPWLDAAGAAAYLAWPRERVYKLSAAGRIPHRKHEGRLLFRRDELDTWLDGYREGPS